MEPSYSVVMQSHFGPIWICATDKGICGIEFGDKLDRMARFLERNNIDAPQLTPTSLLDRVIAQLEDYLNRRLEHFDVPLDLRGTPFQLAVWDELVHIPYGETLTYGEIAMEIERPRAAQAVGRAVGANPVPIIVPCHRVVGHDGSLTGYAYGLERKSALLELEQNGLQLRML